jgi:hypothetical protein
MVQPIHSLFQSKFIKKKREKNTYLIITFYHHLGMRKMLSFLISIIIYQFSYIYIHYR